MIREEAAKRIAGMKERMITNCPTELLPERALLVTEHINSTPRSRRC